MKTRYFSIPLVLLSVIGLAVLFEKLTEPGPGHRLTGAGSAPLSSPPPTVLEAQESVAGNPPPGPATTAAANPTTGPGLASTSNEDPPPDLESAYVQKRTQELQDLAMNDDPASLKTIMSELSNPDPEIRKAALDATIQFASRDAIPGLQEAAVRTTDAKEKAAIEDAIEYLKLPSLTEVIQEQGRKPAPRIAPVQVRIAPAGQPANP